MSADAYQQIIQLVEQLTPDEQFALMQELLEMLRRRIVPQHDSMEFRGMAEDLWKDIDVEQYIQEERDSWSHRQASHKPKHRIMELKGLGKEIWEGIDPQQYIEEERNSWDE